MITPKVGLKVTVSIPTLLSPDPPLVGAALYTGVISGVQPDLFNPDSIIEFDLRLPNGYNLEGVKSCHIVSVS